MAASKVASASASPASCSRTSAVARSRSATASSCRVVGAAASSAVVMRSMAASAISGLVSHVRARRSHSLGPREPKSCTNRANPSWNARAPSDVSAASRSGRPSSPAASSRETSSDRRASRESSHIANDGLAESTSMPPSRRMVKDGSPRPAVIAPSAPGPTDAPSEAQIDVSNICCR